MGGSRSVKRKSFQDIVNEVAAENARRVLDRAVCCRLLSRTCATSERRVLYDLETKALIHLFNKFRVQILPVENEGIEASISGSYVRCIANAEPRFFEWRSSLPIEVNAQVAMRA